MRPSNNHGFNLDPYTLKSTNFIPGELSSLKRQLESLFVVKADPTDLPNELRLKLEEDVKELPGSLKSNMKTLKQRIEEEELLNARTDELFLAAFLRGRKHDVDKAFQCLKNFYEFKYKYPELYKFIYPSKNPEVFDQNHFGNIAGVDRMGRRVCIIKPGKLRLDDVPLGDSFRLGTTIVEMMLNDLVLQVNGTVILFDWSELSLFNQGRVITPTNAWHLAMIVQDKIPIRLKAIHVINQPFYFSTVYTIFKPLLKKKLRKRIFLHGSNLESLHKHIDPEELPEDFGGKKEKFSMNLTRTLIYLNEHKLKEWEKYSYKDLK